MDTKAEGGYVMKRIIYNKLVRDKIPEIIEADGKACEIDILTDSEYINKIDEKLDEELAEYHKDQNLEELADLLEVIHAATVARGYSIEELEALRAQKAEKRGKFEKGFFLKSVMDSNVESILNGECRSIGIDGCKGGWIVADIKNASLEVHRFSSLEETVDKIPFDKCLIDMVIGLQGDVRDVRPESLARKELKGRASTIFPAPCRKAVYGDTKEQRIDINEKVLGKKFTSQTDAIIPKIREVDEFLQRNIKYKNVIEESHPEVCFARLNGEVLMSSKHTDEGIKERTAILGKYLDEVSLEKVIEISKQLKCNADDITDAVCLAIVANLKSLGKSETIPQNPMMDETGLFMQMVVPSIMP